MRKRNDNNINKENNSTISNIEIFKNVEFGSVRAFSIDGEPYFIGKDVAEIPGYSNPNEALQDHVDEEDKLNSKTLSSFKLDLGQRGSWLINESGLYSVILSSKLPTAKKFKRWVTSEVLPTLRKTGGYINNVDLMVNTYFSDVPDEQKYLVKGLLVNIEEKQKKIVSLNNENDLLAQKNLEWADRPLINSLVRAYASSIGDFGKAWNNFKKELLYKHGINLNSRITNYLNTTGKKTKPTTLDMIDDSELANAISTAVSLCRENNVEIDDLLNNKVN